MAAWRSIFDLGLRSLQRGPSSDLALCQRSGPRCAIHGVFRLGFGEQDLFVTLMSHQVGRVYGVSIDIRPLFCIALRLHCGPADAAEAFSSIVQTDTLLQTSKFGVTEFAASDMDKQIGEFRKRPLCFYGFQGNF